jgi:hypothetical protein
MGVLFYLQNQKPEALVVNAVAVKEKNQHEEVCPRQGLRIDDPHLRRQRAQTPRRLGLINQAGYGQQQQRGRDAKAPVVLFERQ